MTFTLDDLRDAFRAGWQERNRSPGLKRRAKRTVGNHLMNAIGGGRYLDHEYVPDTRPYHNSIWVRSEFRKSAQGIEAATADETPKDGSAEGESPVAKPCARKDTP